MQVKSTSGGGGREVYPHQVGYRYNKKQITKNQATNQTHPNPKTMPGQPRQETRPSLNTRKEKSQSLVFSSGWVRFTLLSSRLLEATLRQSHRGLSNHLTHSPHMYSLSEGLVMGLSRKTKTIFNDDGSGEDLGCNPDGK